MSIWTIVGQSGKALDATPRTLDAIKAKGARITFRNLGTDTLTFSIELKRRNSPALLVPEKRQNVSLYRAGVKFFSGIVTGRALKGRTFFITVSGPWWLLERVFMESAVPDKTGVNADRPTFLLPTQSLTTSLTSLITKSIALGVPMAIGMLATTFSAPGMKLNQMNLAQAISDVVRVTPDMVLYFDYSTPVPTMHTVRRLEGLAVGSAATLTLDARYLQPFELDEKTELEVTQVRVPYVKRAADGRQQFATQNAGTAQLGNILIQTVSGPELDTFLPNDLLDFVEIQTVPATVTGDFVATYDSKIAAIKKTYGLSGLGGPTRTMTLYSGQVGKGYWSQKLIRSVSDTTIRDASGNKVSLSGRRMLVAGSLPDWAMRQLGAVKVRFEGRWYGYHVTYYKDASMLNGGGYSEAWKAMFGKDTSAVYWTEKITGPNHYPDIAYVGERGWGFDAVLVSTTITGKRKMYRAPDYNFRFPPAGFADGLLASMNYVPYTGQFSRTEKDAGGLRYMNRAINFTNSQPEHASARAMVTEESIDISTGTTTVVMGPPARFSYLEFVSRFRTNSNDQITYI